jgi:hypothetical protein
VGEGVVWNQPRLSLDGLGHGRRHCSSDEYPCPSIGCQGLQRLVSRRAARCAWLPMGGCMISSQPHYIEIPLLQVATSWKEKICSHSSTTVN